MSLKHEIEAEISLSDRNRRIALVAGISLSLVILITVVMWFNSRPDKIAGADNTGTSSGVNSIQLQSGSTPVNTAPEGSESPTGPVTPTAKAKTPAAYVPSSASVPIDKSSFIAGGRQLIADYNQIVGLLTFSGSMTDAEKASRIKQAMALDKQYHTRVFNLRAMASQAGVSSGAYMQTIERAEDAIASIRTGLTFMGYWANDRSKADDLQVGLGSVGRGSKGLLELSSALDEF